MTACIRKMTIQFTQVEFRWESAARSTIRIDRLELSAGESLLVEGRSGAGKTTLLRMAVGQLQPNVGEIVIGNSSIYGIPDQARQQYIVNKVGYIPQSLNLIDYMSVYENVLLGCRFSQNRQVSAEKNYGSIDHHAKQLIAMLGLVGHERFPAKRLSVGQRQRVAIARALIGIPSIIIADEPTSSLDEQMSKIVGRMFQKYCDRFGSALILASHDPIIQGQFKNRFVL